VEGSRASIWGQTHLGTDFSSKGTVSLVCGAITVFATSSHSVYISYRVTWRGWRNRLKCTRSYSWVIPKAGLDARHWWEGSKICVGRKEMWFLPCRGSSKWPQREQCLSPPSFTMPYFQVAAATAGPHCIISKPGLLTHWITSPNLLAHMASMISLWVNCPFQLPGFRLCCGLLWPVRLSRNESTVPSVGLKRPHKDLLVFSVLPPSQERSISSELPPLHP
jgi:hypothetical protein